MNNKGFTLVEVLATFAVMAIILGIAFPAVDNLYLENKKEIYKSYESGFLAAAKLYVDQYDRDLWTKSQTEHNAVCVKITYNDIKCEDLIKKFTGQSKKESVDENNSYIYAIKSGSKVTYEVFLTIKNNSNAILYKSDAYSKTTITNCGANAISSKCTLTP